MTELLGTRTRQILSGPSSLTLASVGPEGPVCGRAHGARVMDGDLLRLPLLSGHAASVLRAVRGGGGLALVAGDITDLTAFQAKGRALRLERPSDDDRAFAAAHIEELLRASESVVGLPRARNVRVDVDLTLVLRVDEVFHQTPGVGAGKCMAKRAELTAPPLVDDVGALVELEPARAFPAADLASSLDGTVPPALVTCGPGGVPNVSHLSKLERLDDETLAASRQFFRKTAANLAHDPRAVAITLCPRSNRSFALRLRHLRTETEGPVFERLRAQLDAIASLMGMTEVFRLQGADIFRVEDTVELPGLLVEGAA